jgi:hypothetical protein
MVRGVRPDPSSVARPPAGREGWGEMGGIASLPALWAQHQYWIRRFECTVAVLAVS